MQAASPPPPELLLELVDVPDEPDDVEPEDEDEDEDDDDVDVPLPEEPDEDVEPDDDVEDEDDAVLPDDEPVGRPPVDDDAGSVGFESSTTVVFGEVAEHATRAATPATNESDAMSFMGRVPPGGVLVPFLELTGKVLERDK